MKSHSEIELRPYQFECIASMINAKNKKRALIIAPTGSGKTIIFSYYVKLAHIHNGRVLLLVQKNKLVEQTVNALKRYIDDVAVYNAGYGEKRFGQITVASIQLLRNVKERPEFDVVIVDEVHRFSQEYLEEFDNFVIGFTATPWKHNEPIWGEDKFFKEITWQKDFTWMIEQGFLVPPRYFANKSTDFDLSDVKKDREDYVISDLNRTILEQKDKIKTQVADALSRSKGHQKIIVLTTSIDHAKLVHSMLDNASIVHSKQTDKEKDDNFVAYTEGNARFLVSVLIASEGFDHAPSTMLWFMRPTRSIILYIQAVGRVLRLSEGKTHGTVLDYGQVLTNLGTIEDAYKNACKKKKKLDKEPTFCLECFAYNNPDNLVCEVCGEPFKRQCNYCGCWINKGEPCTCEKKVDKLKNLTDEAWSETAKLNIYTLDEYTSKNGNICFRIIYDFEGHRAHEYFIKDKVWAFKNLKERMLTMHTVCPIKWENEAMKWAMPFSLPLQIKPDNECVGYLIKNNGYIKLADLTARQEDNGLKLL